jgi:hypothetical protein
LIESGEREDHGNRGRRGKYGERLFTTLYPAPLGKGVIVRVGHE